MVISSVLLAALVVAAPATGAKKKAKGPGHSSNSCPYVGIAQLDPKGKTSELTGTALPKEATLVAAFDSEGKVGHLRVTSGGSDLHFSDSIPTRMKTMSLLRVLLVEKSMEHLQVMQADQDLPSGANPETVQILLGDSKDPKVALLLKADEDDASNTCDQIHAKVKGAWKLCWTNCAAKSDP